MKKSLLIVFFAAVFSLLFAAEPPNKIKMPRGAGESGPTILFFCGGRPWQASENSKLFLQSGARVVQMDGRFLDGLGGAPIRVHMANKVEPKPFDGITPAFKKLFSYRLIIFSSMSEENLQKLFTPERVAALKKYVENGGHVLLCGTTCDALAELSPVAMAGGMVWEKHYAKRPAGEDYTVFPERIPVPAFREVFLAPGAEALSLLDDDAVTPFLARRTVGKGSVTYFNGSIIKDVDSSNLKSFSGWAYANAFFVAVGKESAGLKKLDAAKHIVKIPAIPERKEVGEVSVSLAAPVWGVTEVSAAPQISGDTATFANGAKVRVLDSGSVEFYYGGDQPLVRNFQIPVFKSAAESVGYDVAAAEGTVSTENVKAANLKWQFDKLIADGNAAVAVYRAGNAEMQWRFVAGKMELDGRSFDGISDSVKLVSCEIPVGQLDFNSEIDMPDALYAHRLSCYSPPRGYTCFDMSGKVSSDTSNWSFFGSGQPFEMLVGKDALYFGAVDRPAATFVQMKRAKDAKAITNIRTMPLGRIYAPFETAPYWHWFGKGAERPHHDYLAMYQFQRHNLRQKANLAEIPVVPAARYEYISNGELEKLIALAVQKGYRYMHVQMPESPIDKIADESRINGVYKMMRDGGIKPWIWSAGSYTQGDTTWIYTAHPEWFIRDPKGNIYCYGGKTYPVIDVNNKEFFDWYCGILRKAIKEGGIGAIYRDMDGTAAQCVNYATKDCPNGLASQIKFYRFLQNEGARVSIEGQNPLVLDEYWYRAHLYTQNFVGNEFVLVGSSPSADLRGGVSLDAFRTGMYGCFVSFNMGPILLDIDVVPEFLSRGRRAMDLAKPFNDALDNVGMPYVRETPFGTSWIGEKGGALFFWNPTKKVTVDLPAGWKIKGIEGNVLTDVKEDTIVLIEKK